MSIRPFRAGNPVELADYLNSFPNDTHRYVIDPSDSRRVVVKDQKIFMSDSLRSVKGLKTGTSIQLQHQKTGKVIFAQVSALSQWKHNLTLLSGPGLHELEGAFDIKDNGTSVEGHNNIVTVVSDGPGSRDGTQTPDPTRNSPDRTQTPPPVRNSPDGTQTPPPVRNSPGSLPDFNYPDAFVPITEYWLKKALEHNEQRPESPIVAILDTGIDYRYNWTMERYPDPDWPLWFNQNPTPEYPEKRGTYPRYAKTFQPDLIGWNFVGTGSSLYSNQHNTPFDDDVAHKHGTRIAAIIAGQTDWNVRLMILKTQDYRGIGTIFTAIEAFSYLKSTYKTLQKNALEKGLNPPPLIVNASWGYYGGESAIFTDALRQLVNSEAEEDVRDHIWFINAAGNNTDFPDAFRKHEIRKGTPTERYPACYGGNQFAGLGKVIGETKIDPARNYVNTNLITVTTLKHAGRKNDFSGSPDEGATLQIDHEENYSDIHVKVGIGAGKDGRFPDPLDPTYTNKIKGTSYAAPYAVARLVNVLNRNRNNAVAGLSAFDLSNLASSGWHISGTAGNRISSILTDVDYQREV